MHKPLQTKLPSLSNHYPFSPSFSLSVTQSHTTSHRLTDDLSDIRLVWDCQLFIDQLNDMDDMSVRIDCTSYRLKQSSLGGLSELLTKLKMKTNVDDLWLYLYQGLLVFGSVPYIMFYCFKTQVGIVQYVYFFCFTKLRTATDIGCIKY